jgi:hypothetical protein
LHSPVIDRSQFELIRERHGSYASWALWAAASDKPKSNIGDLSVLDPDANPVLLRTLRIDVIMVGLNISRPLPEPFRNFHDPSPRANDFKLRHAFIGTDYWGAYMTDIIKNVEMVTSTDVRAHLNALPAVIQSNVHTFLEELGDLNATRPTVLAFGRDAHQLIADHVPPSAYGRLVRVTHYSHQMNKEKYRDSVFAQIAASGSSSATEEVGWLSLRLRDRVGR